MKRDPWGNLILPRWLDWGLSEEAICFALGLLFGLEFGLLAGLWL
jgi:hypothetical protein